MALAATTTLAPQPVGSQWSWRTVLVACTLSGLVVLQVLTIVLILRIPGGWESERLAVATSSLANCQPNLFEDSADRQELPNSELSIRGRLLQLTGRLSWDAKCNRVLHDLVVSCYGAPDYLAQASKTEAYSRNFPYNIKLPHKQMRKLRRGGQPPALPPTLDTDVDEEQLQVTDEFSGLAPTSPTYSKIDTRSDQPPTRSVRRSRGDWLGIPEEAYSRLITD